MSRIDFFSNRFHYTFGPHKPTLRITTGQRLRVICPDSDNQLSDGSVLSEAQRNMENGSVTLAGNPMAGPIWIEGAQPGDSIAVRIEAIHLDRNFGQTGLAPSHGLLELNALSPPRRLYRWTLDAKRGVASLDNPIGDEAVSVPIDPFIGCIGVCPRDGARIPAILAGPHGGNMDVPVTKPGAIIRFPVYVDGALLMLGDLHAAQGHGEIIGGAIETSGVVDCTVDLLKGQLTDTPRIRFDGKWIAIASHDDLRSAVRNAYASLLDWIVEQRRLNRWDAYNLISQSGEILLGNLVNAPYSAGASIAEARL